MAEKMIVYKGTDKNMRCRGYQYELGKTAEVAEPISICRAGLHSCVAPLDVLRYYPVGKGNRYFVGEADGTIVANSDRDSKVASSKLTLTGEIGLRGLIKAHFEYTREKAEKTKTAGGEGSNLAGGEGSTLAGGYRSNLAGGNRSNLAGGNGSTLAGGNRSTLAGGNRSTLAGGDYSNLAGGEGSNLAGGEGSTLAGGYRSNLAGGNRSNLAGGDGSNLAGGNYSTLAGGYRSTLAGGDESTLAGGNDSTLAGGDYSTIAGGNGSLIVGRNGCRAKGGIGSVIVLTEWDDDDHGNYHPVHATARIVDGVNVKPDVWYTLKGGEFVEDEEHDHA